MLIVGDTAFPLLGLTLIVLGIGTAAWVLRPQLRHNPRLRRVLKLSGYALAIELLIAVVYVAWLIMSPWPDMQNF
jgi:hypothetical protein